MFLKLLMFKKGLKHLKIFIKAIMVSDASGYFQDSWTVGTMEVSWAGAVQSSGTDTCSGPAETPPLPERTCSGQASVQAHVHQGPPV